MKNLIGFALCLLAFTSAHFSKAQCTTSFPPLGTSTFGGILESKNGYYLPPNGTIKILLIFVEVDYSGGGTDPVPGGNAGWPAGQLPTWKDQLLDQTISPNPVGYLTKYFKESSFGQYNVLGDYLVNPADPTKPVKVPYSAFSVGNVLTYINTNYTSFQTAHLVPQTDFDNWTMSSAGEAKTSPSIDNPRKYDHIMFIYRNLVSYAGDQGGSAHNGSAGVLFSYSSDTWSKFGAWTSIPDKISRHEYSHLLYGSNNFHCGGGGIGSPLDFFIPRLGGWSNMGLHNCSFLSCNAWDRRRMDWKGPGKTLNISARNSLNNAEINGDLDATNFSQTGIYILRDFVTTGDAIRIKFPYLDPQNEYGEWLWLENHQTSLLNNTMTDHYQYGGNCTAEEATPGLYSYVQIDKEQLSGSTNIFGGAGTYLRPLSANGSWDYTFETTTQVANCINSDPQYPYKRPAGNDNALTGNQDQELPVADNDQNSIINDGEERPNWIENVNGNYITNVATFGRSSHSFTLAGNKKIGISTNPSAANMMNLVSYNWPAPVTGIKNVRKIYLNNISIEILEENVDGNGAMKVRIRFDDNAIENDVRWCADDIVLSAPVNGQTYSAVLKDSKVLTLAQSRTATKIDNPTTLANNNKAFSGRTKFSCVNGAKFNMENNATMNLTNESMFIVKSGATTNLNYHSTININDSCAMHVASGGNLTLPNSGYIRVKSGGTLHIKSGANVTLNFGSQIIVEDGGYICIEQGANVNLIDTQSQIIWNAFANTGIAPNAVTYTPLYPSTGCQFPCDVVYTGQGSVVYQCYNNCITNYNPNIGNNDNFFTVAGFNNNLITETGTTYKLRKGIQVTAPVNIEYVNCTFEFSEIGRFIIDPGAKVKFTNCTLRNITECGPKMWKGVEVRGNSTLNQLTTSNQGYLIVNTGTVIENAITGIQATKMDDNGNEITTGRGGIIQMEAGTIRNCQRGVYFPPYQNMNGSQEVSNVSHIYRALFTTTATLLNSGLTPATHIDMSGVRGIDIKGCTFNNTATGIYSPLNRGKGITAVNSSFTVVPFCTSQTTPCPTGNTIRNTFTNLYYGIFATGTSTTPKHSVNKADFTNCWYGAFSSAINYVEYTENKFDNAGTPGNAPPTPNVKYGLYLQNSTAYKIEENEFKATAAGSMPTQGTNLGLYITNSGRDNNLVYNNTFNKLYVGATAHGNNRSSTGATGLVFKCNDFTQCPFDISVITPTSPAVTYPGIAQYQGTTGAVNTNPAGNTFTNTSHTADYSNCTTCQAIVYRMHASPIPSQGLAPTIMPYNNQGSISVVSVVGTTYSKKNSCPSTLSGGGGTGTGLRTMVINETEHRDLAKEDYETTVDGGITQDLIAQVAYATPSNAYDVYTDLKAKAGLLSDTVLIAAASKEYALPDVLVKDILLDNPQAVRNAKVLDTLRNRAVPMDEADIDDIIIAAEDRVSVIEDKESVVSDFDNRRSYAVNRLISYHADAGDEDSTTAILVSEKSPAYKYDLAEFKLRKGQVNEAEDLVESISTDVESFDKLDAYENEAYTELFGILKGQTIAAKYVTDIDSNQAAALRTIIANYPNTRATIIAQNILRSVTGDVYPEEILLPEIQPSAKKIHTGSTKKDALVIYPNPAKGWFAIEYNAPVANTDKIEIVITDINGAVIKTLRIGTSQNRIIVNADFASVGVYFVKLNIDGITISTSKLVLN